ncbi:MAG TPA: histidine phosphatase family protein [Frankiaceae bacterium]|nr:histidine phosphatase family protein [Frankiaceae bacterium]
MTDAADLLIWRHGRTEWNDTGRFQGQQDPPLDSVGHVQGRAAAVALAALKPVAIVSSDLGRASATAAYLASETGLEVTYDARLREIDVGAWGGLTRPEIEERFPEEWASLLRGEDVRRGGGETLSEVGVRAAEAATEHLGRAGGVPLVLVTHGGTARALVMALLGMRVKENSAFAAMGNARWAALAHRELGWQLTAYNVGREPEASEAGRDDATAQPVL